MARFKLDLRPKLRELATRAQDENQERLLSGESVSGAPFAPRARRLQPVTTRKRIRIKGEKKKIADLSTAPGVRSGEMVKDATRRSNQKIGRTSAKIVPSPEVRVRWAVFNKGDQKQPSRFFSGISGETHEDAAEQIATASRDQALAFLARERRG